MGSTRSQHHAAWRVRQCMRAAGGRMREPRRRWGGPPHSGQAPHAVRSVTGGSRNRDGMAPTGKHARRVDTLPWHWDRNPTPASTTSARHQRSRGAQHDGTCVERHVPQCRGGDLRAAAACARLHSTSPRDGATKLPHPTTILAMAPSRGRIALRTAALDHLCWSRLSRNQSGAVGSYLCWGRPDASIPCRVRRDG